MSEKPEECSFCRWETSKLTEYTHGQEPAWLCELCEQTDGGSMALYPRLNHDVNRRELTRTMTTLTHIILAAIRKAR